LDSKPNIPRLPHAFFKWYCRKERYEELHGDLEEFFYERAEKSLTNAKLLYWWDVIRCCQPYAWKKVKSQSRIQNQTDMISNFIRMAIRSLIKQKAYSAINTLGFAISISACILIVLYVRNEMSYDNFFSKGDRIYKVALERIYPEHRTFYALVPHSFASVMKKDFPEVENTLVVQGPMGNVMVSYQYGATEMKSFEEQHFLVSDSTFFDFFDLDLIKGDRNTMLSKPKQVMITESTAIRYFGMDDPIGKVLNTDVGDFTVAGVCEDLPDNTHLQFDFVGSIETFPGFQRENFTSLFSHAYLMVKPGTDPKALEAKFPQMVNRYAASAFERESEQSWADYIKPAMVTDIFCSRSNPFIWIPPILNTPSHRVATETTY
jgi:putative ABC transport system permease protein